MAQTLKLAQDTEGAPVALHPINHAAASDRACPRCSKSFLPRRKDQRYCGRSCSKAATRNANRGSRERENRQRSEAHYSRASWLSYDVNRMPQEQQRAMLLAILEAASGADAALRNILLDPALLGADRASGIGKMYPDTNDPSRLNIAKMANAFCHEEWGCSLRHTILDDNEPAGRLFREEISKAPPHYIERNPADLVRARRKEATIRRPYDWRRLARSMGDKGWRSYYSQEELDRLL